MAKSVVYADHAGLSPAEYEEGIAESINSELTREAAGKHPSAGTKTWREYWQWRYSLWRKKPESEKWIAYTRRRREQLRLRYI